jgi:protein involved in polysaccharide export with SLBB domain
MPSIALPEPIPTGFQAMPTRRPSAGALLLVLYSIGLMAACGTPQGLADPPAASAGVGAGASAIGNHMPSPDNVAVTGETNQLVLLWKSRTRADGDFDYPLGPGDVVQISVPAIQELTDSTERIPGDGQLSLPFVGTIKAAGLTEDQLKSEIVKRLDAYLFHPEVTLFAKEYRSRLVAVTGSVNKPGLYLLASGRDKLFDMLDLAGGVTDDAAPRVLLFPSEWQSPAECSHAFATLAGKESHLNEGAAASVCGRAIHANSVALRSSSADTEAETDTALPDVTFAEIDLSNAEEERYLSMPARPGDILVVPPAGEVLIDGWVDKPGHYKITPGLTVLGAVTAAGGTTFAAQDSAVKVLRSTKQGEKQLLVADLGKIADGQAPDIEVRQNDVVYVSYSSLKLAPYGVLWFVKKFSMGGFMPIVP